MRVVFAGTPEFAAVALQRLHAAGFEIPLVLTQPDRPAGRGMKLQASPVKAFAQAHGIAVAQPRGLKLDGKYGEDAAAAREALLAARPEVMVVAAYGLILPAWVLELPRLGCLNIHASLLPRWRGAAPIHRAIEAGDAETGITIMQMDAGMDTGPMLSIGLEPIRSDDTTLSLGERMSYLGAQLLIDTLPGYLNGSIEPHAQPTDGITYSPKINKSDAHIDWTRSAIEIDRAVWAYMPWPGAFTDWNGQLVKVLKTGIRAQGSGIKDQGTVIRLADGAIGVVTGDGVLELIEIQLAGRKAMSARDFVRGQPTFINAQFTRHSA